MEIELQTWARENQPEETMRYQNSFWQQIYLLRDHLPWVLGAMTEHEDRDRGKVIAEHKSRSIILPVVRYTLKRARVVVRGNFSDFKVSVDADEKLVLDARELFDPSMEHPSCYCEGFPEDLVFGSYNENARQFTASLSSEYSLWAFARAIRLAIGDLPA